MTLCDDLSLQSSPMPAWLRLSTQPVVLFRGGGTFGSSAALMHDNLPTFKLSFSGVLSQHQKLTEILPKSSAGPVEAFGGLCYPHDYNEEDCRVTVVLMVAMISNQDISA